ncbi:hypothetical protein [uncultured Amphritea sp.]|uniref:hypothetical protein n=1 Tax=uncultured Amphritea sp. TaxID=981605 RepID=UPI0025F253B4|nr:hypothetical protein [uncultured Amphritea sp.]
MKKLNGHNLSGYLLSAAVAAATAAMAMPAQAYNLYSQDGAEVNLDVEAVFGTFSSEETYGNSASDPGWQEGYIKYGFSGSRDLGNGATLFGAANAVSSGTWGDGDAAGLTTGDETKTKIEDLYIGFRTDMFELSAGRQNLSIGDGFILNGDSLNLGKGLEGIDPAFEPDRGGAYWLAARKAFDKTVVARIGGDAGLRSDIFWIESDNAGQASMELGGANLEYVTEKGTFGAMYIKGLGVDAGEAAFMGLEGRDGQKTISVRYQGNAGVENLFLSAEYVSQEDGVSGDDTNAWYAEAGWTFADAPWAPSVNYRFTRYDEGYDPLFFGFSRGYGTWFQGEVAANYAGPFGTGTDINYLGVTAHPTEMLTVGAGYFNFEDKNDTDAVDLSANELNIWAEWVAMDHLIISPVLGFYTPDSANSSQGNDNTNTYAQIIAIVPF